MEVNLFIAPGFSPSSSSRPLSPHLVSAVPVFVVQGETKTYDSLTSMSTGSPGVCLWNYECNRTVWIINIHDRLCTLVKCQRTGLESTDGLKWIHSNLQILTAFTFYFVNVWGFGFWLPTGHLFLAIWSRHSVNCDLKLFIEVIWVVCPRAQSRAGLLGQIINPGGRHQLQVDHSWDTFLLQRRVIFLDHS